MRLEDRVIAIVGRAAVNGHDLGSNEANIVIFIDDQASVVQACLRTVREAGILWKFAAGYRALGIESTNSATG